MMRKWAKFIMTTPMKVVVFLVACGLLGGGIYGATVIPRTFEWKKISTDGSYFRQYAEARDTKFPQGYGVSVILPESLNYSSSAVQEAVIDLDQIAQENSRFLDYTVNWMTLYRAWATSNNVTDLTGDNFYKHLTAFRTAVKFINADLVMHSDDYVFVSRVIFFYENDIDAVNQANAMTTIRDDLRTKSSIEGIFPSTIAYIYVEQTEVVLPLTIQNLAISGAAILFITLPYLMHPGITLLVFLSFTSLIFELLGLMSAWDVSMDALATVIVIMAIGFSVDYTCHVAHAYMISTKRTPEKRIIHALETLGVSVLNGGISTILGMLVTAFSQAEGFRIFFKMTFGIVLLGLLHGLVFLPVLLTIFVRRDLRGDMKKFLDKHDKREQKRSMKRMSRMSYAERKRESFVYRTGVQRHMPPVPEDYSVDEKSLSRETGQWCLVFETDQNQIRSDQIPTGNEIKSVAVLDETGRKVAHYHQGNNVNYISNDAVYGNSNSILNKAYDSKL